MNTYKRIWWIFLIQCLWKNYIIEIFHILGLTAVCNLNVSISKNVGGQYHHYTNYYAMRVNHNKNSESGNVLYTAVTYIKWVILLNFNPKVSHWLCVIVTAHPDNIHCANPTHLGLDYLYPSSKGYRPKVSSRDETK